MYNAKPYTIRFLNQKEIAKDTHVFYFERPREFEFIAGQYNRWTLPIDTTDGRGSSRFFTISSSPLEKDHLAVTTKIIQSDFKKALLQLKPSDQIKIFGPMGQFFLDDKEKRQQVMIAGGIGITPFYSMLLYATAAKRTIPLTLFVSFSVAEDIAYFDALKTLEKDHPNIKIIYTITKPEESKKPWSGETGRVNDALLKKYVHDLGNSIFYVVGPPPMVERMQTILKEMQIPDENFKTEQFTGY